MDVANINSDDSFNNLIPSSSQIKGRKIIKNFENKSKNSVAPARALRYSNKDFVVTCLNEQISFIAVNAKSVAKHDGATYGIKPCRLFPYCSEMFKGGEDIALVYIVSPVGHQYYEEECWVCEIHARASMNGEEVQIIQKLIANDTHTPKNKTKQETPKAPKKSTRKKASGGARKKEDGGRKKNGNAWKKGDILASDQGVLE